MLTLHIVQALHGDCTILEYGAPAQPHLMLVDGGPPTVFADHLHPALVEFAARGLRLGHVVLTHSDDDHVVGLVDLFTDTRRQVSQNRQPVIPIDAVWMNSFAFDARFAPSLTTIQPAAMAAPPLLDGSGLFPDLGYADAIDLRTLVAQLGIPLNPELDGGTVSTNRLSTLALDGMTLTLVGPSQANLARMKKEWDAYVAQHAPGAPETFVPTEVLPGKVAPDQSIPNRSSFMFLVEDGGRRALLTGDGRASDILNGLEHARLLPKGGTLHVDIFKLPHHGSARNNSRRLFERVTADTYVISANGRDGNPDEPTLAWLLCAARARSARPRIVATNLAPSLERLLQSHPPGEWGYTLDILPAGAATMAIPLA